MQVRRSSRLIINPTRSPRRRILVLLPWFVYLEPQLCGSSIMLQHGQQPRGVFIQELIHRAHHLSPMSEMITLMEWH
jgi:hypothetical protein